MNDQSDSLASTSATFTHQERKDKLSIRKHNIDPAKSYMRINKKQLDFSHLSKEIKYFFISVYQQCFQTNSLATIFKGWEAKIDNSSVAKSIGITDGDAIPLILKMLKVLDSQSNHKGRQYLERNLSMLNTKLSDLYFLHKQITFKKNNLQRFNIHNGETIAAQQVLDKMSSHQKHIQSQIQQLESHKQSLLGKLQAFNDQFTTQLNSAMIKRAMNKTISKMSRNLIKQSILFIIEGQNIPSINFCQAFIVFQQSYHTIRLNRKDIVRLIGSEAYLQKVKLSASLKEQSESSQNLSLFSCHSCMKLFPSSALKHCSTKISEKETKSYISSDFIMYRNNVIHSDYFASANQHVLTYFTYNRDSNDELCCNRSYCLPCLQDVYKIQASTHFNCPFCCGNCNCRRCQAAVALVKCIAQDVDYDIELQSKYHQILNLLSQGSNNAFHCLALRKIDDSSEFSFLASQSSNKSDSSPYQVLTNNTLKEEEVIIQQQEDKVNKIAELSLHYQRDQQIESLFLNFGENVPNEDLHLSL